MGSKLWTIARSTLRDAKEDRVNGLAAEVAFFAVLSVFPGLLVFADALGSLEAFTGIEFARDAQRVVVDFLRGILTERADATVDAVEALFTRESGGVATVATVLAVLSLSRAFGAVIRALDLAYDVESERAWLRLRFLALGASLVTIVLAAVVLAAFVVGPLFGGAQTIADRLGFGGAFAFAWSWLRWPVAFALLVAWAATLYRVVPQAGASWRDGLPGAGLAAVAWIAASLGLSAYLRFAGRANPVLGLLGGGLILLVWLYLMALALLLGAELNGVLHRGGDARVR